MSPAAGPGAAAAIPAAPLMVPAAAPRVPDAVAADVREMRAAASRALAGLADAEVVVLLASDGSRDDPPGAPAATIQLTTTADLDGFGLRGTARPLKPHRELADQLADRTGWPVVEGDPPGLAVDLASLALQLVEAVGTAPVVPVALAAGVNPSAAAAALREIDLGGGAVLAAGDLSAGLTADSPRPFIDGAAPFDHRILAAVSTGHAEDLIAEGPAEAMRVWSRGWASLTATQLLVARRADEVVYRRLCGVGQLVASWSAP